MIEYFGERVNMAAERGNWYDGTTHRGFLAYFPLHVLPEYSLA